MDKTTHPGDIIREWRRKRRLSQLDLALEADISQRHLSFLESGRSRPSRDMALALCERLDMPLRQRNRLLLAAGHAPDFAERPLESPQLKPAMNAVRKVLDAHMPSPAIAVDRLWNLELANSAAKRFLDLVADPALLKPPVNVLRLSLHPKGLAPLIVNLGAWRTHLLHRLARLNDTHADPQLEALEQELRGYPGLGERLHGDPIAGDIAVPLILRLGDMRLSFISTVSVFGTPLEVTLSELAIESFFPADEATTAALRAMAAA